MTLKQFDETLKEFCSETGVYELAAPKGTQRFVVWHCYGRNTVSGDNRNQVNFPKVQIDIVTPNRYDYLVDDVAAALWSMDLTYSVQSEGYDPDYNAYRTILQLVVA